MSRRSAISKWLLAAVTAGLILVPTAGSAHPGAQAWVARHNGAGNDTDTPRGIEVSPDGTRVFVAGYSRRLMATWSSDYAVIAYDAATGSQVWSATYNGPENGFDSVAAIKVSPDGSRVCVTGVVTRYEPSGEFTDVATIAYNAATGTQLWIAFYDSPPGSHGVVSLTLSPDGAKVYITGRSRGEVDDDYDYATVAYDASSGTQLWASRYQNGQAPYDAAYSVAASPDGEKVFITGSTNAGATTVAYDAQDGKELWVAKELGSAQIWAQAFTTIASVDSSQVYITGWTASSDRTSDLNYFTSAYDAETGSRLWWSEYGEPTIQDAAVALTQSLDGSLVYVTGGSARDYATIAYNSNTGDEVWVARYSGSTEPDGWDTPADIAISTNGQLIVTGTIGDFSRGLWQDYYGTVAYDASTGQQLWATHSGTGNERATAIAVNPAGTRAFVTGMSTEFQTREDWATFALELGDGFDGTAPTSSFDTNDEAIFVATPLTPSPYVSGWATDDHSGVAEVTVVFEPLVPLGTTLTQSASLSCTGPDRRSCAWSSPLPSTPGRYRVWVTARDRDDNRESPGLAPIEILIL